MVANHTRRPPSLAEITSAIGRLNPSRAAGIEGLKAEVLQLGSEVLAPIIRDGYGRIRTCRRAGRNPSSSHSKKGKPASSIASYRPINLVSLASKIVMLVLHARLTPMVDDTVGEYQSGFRAARSTTDAIITLRLLCEKYSHTQARQLYIAFIDLTQAFDRVSWELLWHSLRLSGAPEPLIQVLRTLCENINMRIRTEPAEEDPRSFHPTAGVR